MSAASILGFQPMLTALAELYTHKLTFLSLRRQQYLPWMNRPSQKSMESGEILGSIYRLEMLLIHPIMKQRTSKSIVHA